MLTHPPLVPAKAGTQTLRLRLLGPRWSLCSGQPKAGPECRDERGERRAGLTLACAAAVLAIGTLAARAELKSYAVVGDAIPNSLTGTNGDPVKGRAIVANRQVGLCLLCHSGPFPEERFQGTLAPDLAGAGTRWSPGQLRLRIVDSTRINPATIMPPYYRIDDLTRVAPAFTGKPLLNAEQIEDVVSYLSTLQDLKPQGQKPQDQKSRDQKR